MKTHVAGLLFLPLLIGALAPAQAAGPLRRPYIVQLTEKPAASYDGTIAGLRATRPAAGARLDARSAAVTSYAGYLRTRQAAVLGAYRGARMLHSYQLVYNGFSALLTDAEALALRRQTGIAAVKLQLPRKLDTHYTPTYLGLDGPGGLWSQLGGSGKAGEGVVVGVIDTGIWPEHPAFADRVDGNGKPTFDPHGTLAYGAPPARWKGSCQAGQGFTAANCNNKLIGARAFNTEMLATGAVLYWNEFSSARDAVAVPGSGLGHGTHTTSTAAGNHGVTPVLDGMPVAAASGMAPRARVAAYKVCWTFTTPDAPDYVRNSCMPGDAVAAVEQAVADGVDVLNFSIGGYQSIDDPVDLAFLGAADAGVFVAASAGNSAPYFGVVHAVPWLTTVAATNHDKATGAVLQVTGGPRFVGGSTNRAALPARPFVLARDSGRTPFADLAPQDQAARAQCFSADEAAAIGASIAELPDPALVQNKILLCEGGGNEPKAKSLVAKAAGAAGMVLLEVDQAPHYVDFALPTVNLLPTDGGALFAYLAEHADATMTMSTFGLQDGTSPAPTVTYFSSRGPNAIAPGVMKPDLAAPGLEILAGAAPPGDRAYRDRVAAGGADPADAFYRFHTGTSMASPHIAGIGALLRQQHPGWSPAAIKSALMTTATATQDDGNVGEYAGQLPWGQGAGLVQPTPAGDPGLVYDAGPLDYQRFLCGLNAAAVSAADCQASGKVADTDFNQAALTVPAIADTETLRRSVTNVGSTTATYRATAVLDGFDVTVSPAELTLAAGATASFNVTLKRTSAPNLDWQYGALEWSDGTHRVRSPLQARAMVFDAPQYLRGGTAVGQQLFPVKAGSAAKLKVAMSGLVAPQRDILKVTGATTDSDYGLAECLAGGSPRVAVKHVTIPAGTLGARFGVFMSDSSGATSDGFIDELNLLVIDPHQQLVGLALWNFGGSASTVDPEPGDYTLCVSSGGPSNGIDATFALSSWIIAPGQDAGNVVVAAPARLGKNSTGTVGLSWSGLDNSKRYYGVLQYLLDGRPERLSELFVDAEHPEGLPTTPAPILRSVPPLPLHKLPGRTVATAR